MRELNCHADMKTRLRQYFGYNKIYIEKYKENIYKNRIYLEKNTAER